MGERGRERVREHFTLDRMIGALERVYTGVIGAEPGSGAMGKTRGCRGVLAGAVLTVLLGGAPLDGLAKEVPYTLEDRDRLIRVESRLEGIERRLDQIDRRFEQVDKRFEQVERRIERLETVMISGFGLLFTSMIGLVGFVLWDRRTALAPAVRMGRELEERQARLERVLRELARDNPKVAEILRQVGLL